MLSLKDLEEFQKSNRVQVRSMALSGSLFHVVCVATQPGRPPKTKNPGRVVEAYGPDLERCFLVAMAEWRDGAN